MIVSDLDTICRKRRTDKSSASHCYSFIYEELFAPLRTQPVRLLEISIQRGESLLTWEDYFPNAQLFAVDINDACARFASPRTKVLIGDATDDHFMDRLLQERGYESIYDYMGYLNRHLMVAGSRDIYLRAE